MSKHRGLQGRTDNYYAYIVLGYGRARTLAIPHNQKWFQEHSGILYVERVATNGLGGYDMLTTPQINVSAACSCVLNCAWIIFGQRPYQSAGPEEYEYFAWWMPT